MTPRKKVHAVGKGFWTHNFNFVSGNNMIEVNERCFMGRAEWMEGSRNSRHIMRYDFHLFSNS